METDDIIGGLQRAGVLVIVESTEHARLIAGMLGLRTFATAGHLLTDPPSDTGPAFDTLLHLRRVPRYPNVYNEISRILDQDQHDKKMMGIMLALDLDDEGEVIANDVASLVQRTRPDIDLFRVQIQAFDKPSLQRALADAKSWSPGPGTAAGLARASLDRIILEQGGQHGIGRVITPILAMTHEGALDRVTPSLTMDRPWSLRDLLVMSRGDNVKSRYDAVQYLYLHGHISYPRTNATLFATSTQDLLQARAQRSEIKISRPALETLDPSAPHEAIWPLRDQEWDQDPEFTSAQEAIRVFLGRAAFSAIGVDPEREWGPPPGASQKVDSKLVDLQANIDLGRPSTWAARIHRMMGSTPEDALILENGTLSESGLQALAGAPEFLKDPHFSINLERYIAAEAARGKAPHEIVTSALDAFPVLHPPASSRDAPMEQRRLWDKIPVKFRL
ncbi:MAG: toprim domain-containing protein [Acidiferrobacteraceae bacterium]